MTDHPITPPPELVRQWTTSFDCPEAWGPKDQWIASKAAQWAADQELEACCEWLKLEGHEYEHEALLAARRSKAPSLKEQALDELVAAERLYPADWSTIRRALEQLND